MYIYISDKMELLQGEKKAYNNKDKMQYLNPVILLVSHDQTKLSQLKTILKDDYTLYTSSTGQEATQILKNIDRIDALIFDNSLPESDGGVFIRQINGMASKPENIIKILIGESTDKEVSFVGTYGGKIDYFYNHSFDPEQVKQKLSYLMAQKSKEKRSAMRVNLTNNQKIRVDTGVLGQAPIENISENGMFINAPLPKDQTLPFKLTLPDGSLHQISGHVVHSDEVTGGVGVRFLEMDEKSRMTLSRFISEYVTLKDLTELKDRYPFLNIENIVVFTDKTKIEALIADALKSQTEVTAIPLQSKLPTTLQLVKADPWHYCHLSGENLDKRFKTSDSIFISFQMGYATYNFESVVYRIESDGTRIEILYPQILFYSEKRSLNRASPDKDLHLEILLPSPFDTTIRGAITDISNGGVSFMTESKEIALLAGTPIESIRIFQGQELVRETRGEVRNILKVVGDNKDRIRYGLQFGIGRLAIQTSELPDFERSTTKPRTKDTDFLRSGPRRQSDLSELAKKPPQVIRLENSRGEEIVGLLDSSLPLDNEPIPVILIPPAFGKSKETLFALAQTIIENFYTRGKPVAVIRYDGIRRKGESYKDPEASTPPYEMLNASLSQGAMDIKAILDWIDMNPKLKASAVIMVTFSLAALEARLVLRDDAYRRKVHYWIACMGTPELRHLLTRVNCGLDLLEQYQLGIELGVMPVLGNLVNVDKYMKDAIANSIATLDQAREDMKLIDIPITWIYGENDHWVKPEFIRDVMGIDADALREVIPVSLGHNARTSKEALLMFGAITSLAHRFLYLDTIKPRIPLKANLHFKRLSEKDRIPKRDLSNRDEYWRRYLVGEQELLGFDVLSLADDYTQLMHDQARALKLSDDDHLLDLGGGTGNFISYLLENNEPLPKQITIADLIPDALKQASDKLKPLLSHSQWEGRFDSICCDVEMSRYLPVKRFITGEIAGFKELVDRIENLTIQTAIKIEESYSPRLHRILRGRLIDKKMEEWLKRNFELLEIRTIMDFNKASRYIKRLDRKKPSYRQLVFSNDRVANLRLPFKLGYYNKIVLSLVLPYIYNPLETLIELRRIISPDGILVISSLWPDADASGLFIRLVEKVEKMPENAFPKGWDKKLILSSIRSFLNDAQALVELEEAGTFDFFYPEKLNGLLEEAGFQPTRNEHEK